MQKLYLSALLVVALATAQAPATDYDAQAAFAMALAVEGLAKPVKPAADLCPCSLTNVCTCTDASQCGCIDAGSYRWVPFRNAPCNQTALYRGSVQVGNWCPDDGAFFVHDGAKWVKATCPVAVPQHITAKRAATVQAMPTTQTYALPVQRFGYGFAGGSCGPSGCR